VKPEFVAQIVERLVQASAVGGDVKVRRVCDVESFLFEGEGGVDHGRGLDIAVCDLQNLLVGLVADAALCGWFW